MYIYSEWVLSKSYSIDPGAFVYFLGGQFFSVPPLLGCCPGETNEEIGAVYVCFIFNYKKLVQQGNENALFYILSKMCPKSNQMITTIVLQLISAHT